MAWGAWLIWWGWWDDDGEVAGCCEESWRRCKLGGHRSFLLQFQAMVSQEEDDDDIQGLPVWKWKNWKAKESKIQTKQELWKQVELMRFRKMACNSATALARTARWWTNDQDLRKLPALFVSSPTAFLPSKKTSKSRDAICRLFPVAYFVPPKNLASADKSPPFNITIPHLNLKGMLHL